jgi:hypothetical protein
VLDLPHTFSFGSSRSADYVSLAPGLLAALLAYLPALRWPPSDRQADTLGATWRELTIDFEAANGHRMADAGTGNVECTIAEKARAFCTGFRAVLRFLRPANMPEVRM